jgi:gluconolactonase
MTNARVVITLFLSAIVVSIGHAQQRPRGDPSIIAPTATLETVFDGGFFTEGPAAAPDGTIYFSDITQTWRTKNQAGHIWRYNPRTGQTSIYRSPSGMANGITFDLQGRMIVAEGADFGGRRVTRTDMTTGRSEIIAGVYNGRPFNSPNDVAIDAKGRIYFTDPRYFGHEPVEQPVQGVYRIDIDGSVRLIVTDANKPNGVLVSPDQKTLYVAATDDGALGTLPQGMTPGRGRMALLAYDLAPDGTAQFRNTVVDYSTGGFADGMAIDRNGNIYVAGGKQPRGVYVYSPDGRELAHIPTPAAPRNTEFGRGADRHWLYIAAGGGLFRIRVEQEGFHPADK